MQLSHSEAAQDTSPLLYSSCIQKFAFLKGLKGHILPTHSPKALLQGGQLKFQKGTQQIN